MGRKVNAGGCLRSLLVLALLCAMAVLGFKTIQSHVGGAGRGGIKEYIENASERNENEEHINNTNGQKDDGAPDPGPRADGISDFVPDAGGYERVEEDASGIYKGDLILVNGDAPYQFLDDNELVSLYDYKSGSYKVKDKDVLLARRIISPLNDLFDDFYAAHQSNTVNIISGYRSYEFQQTLLNARIEEQGEVEAYKYVALPGSSEHHTGLAMDLDILHANGTSDDYTGTGIYAWINENAYLYGFIVRYDESKKDITGISYEPWHLRYVGIPHAYVMRREGFCLEEYIDFLRGYEYGKRHLLVTCGEKSYEIYFTRDIGVYVPKDREYAISGNNVDGFIVTAAY